MKCPNCNARYSSLVELSEHVENDHGLHLRATAPETKIKSEAETDQRHPVKLTHGQWARLQQQARWLDEWQAEKPLTVKERYNIRELIAFIQENFP